MSLPSLAHHHNDAALLSLAPTCLTPTGPNKSRAEHVLFTPACGFCGYAIQWFRSRSCRLPNCNGLYAGAGLIMSQHADRENDAEAERQDAAEPQQQQIGSELAKAFQDLAKGERTASALESRLDGIESRIEQLLASMEGEASYRSSNADPTVEKPVSDSAPRSK